MHETWIHSTANLFQVTLVFILKTQTTDLTSSVGRVANGFMTAARGTWDCLVISEVQGIL